MSALNNYSAATYEILDGTCVVNGISIDCCGSMMLANLVISRVGAKRDLVLTQGGNADLATKELHWGPSGESYSASTTICVWTAGKKRKLLARIPGVRVLNAWARSNG